jgi:retron-type reverse transcriptase
VLKAVFRTGIAEMPTRSYYFPTDFVHIEAILKSENPDLTDAHFLKFRERGIAPLLTALDIATVMGIGPGLLVSMTRKPDRHYRLFALTKKDGTERVISAPRTYLKVIQWWILDNILNQVRTPDNVFGFSKGKSIHDNARHHVGSAHILNVDIKAFFDTVTFKQVYLIFLDLGYERMTSITLARLCTLDGSLPQGAPTSPSIANFVLAETDQRLQALAVDMGMKYSRYADDLTFSSSEFIAPEFLVQVDSKIREAGFELKAAKTRYAGTGGRREVTGLISGEFVQPPLEWRKRNRSRLHRLSQKAVLERADIAYLLGLKGYSMQFPDAVQMQALSRGADGLLSRSRPAAKTA